MTAAVCAQRVLTTQAAFVIAERAVCREVAQLVHWDLRPVLTVVPAFQCDVTGRGY